MKQQEEAKTPTLVERLRQVYEAEMRAANDCDGRPEHTANWQYACTVMEAINALSASQSSRQQIAAVRELVRLKDLKDHVYFACPWKDLSPAQREQASAWRVDYERNLPLAWAAVRSLIPAEVEGQREDV